MALNADTSNSPPKNNHAYIIVGIGASAGGLEALRQLVPSLPIDERVMYVLAQHLDPKHSSMLVPILARETTLTVTEAQHGQKLEAKHLYVIPPAMDAYYHNGKLHLEKATGLGPKPSVDRLLASLAENHGERSIGIILSGTGMDGAHGIRAVKAEGGITIAQLESTARFDSMPHAAINTGHVDLVLPPEEMGQHLQDFLAQPDSPFLFSSKNELSEDEIQDILKALFEHTGTDFRNYKRNTLLRRIERRMTVHKFKDLTEYRIFLKQKPEELYELHNDILISVTSFFRDTDAFQALHRAMEHIIPKHGNDIRVWVAGCATGEEAYSIAIALSEYLGNRINRYKVQIFGTDLYDHVLSIARQARYPKTAVVGIEEHLLDKYFVQKDGNYQLTQNIRNMVLFAKHDLIRDPPFSHLNLVSCRNVMIYFKQNLQKNVLESFHYALEPNGILFLGKSETIGNNERLYTTIDRKARIYRKREDVKSHLPHLINARHQRDNSKQSLGSNLSREKGRLKLQEIVEKILLTIYQPDCILLDDRQELIYVRGNVDSYISFNEGRAGLNILELIRPELRQDLRGLLYKARRTDDVNPINSRRIHLKLNNGQLVRLVMRIKHFAPGKFSDSELSLLIFEYVAFTDEQQTEHDTQQFTDTVRLRELEEELKETRESLQTTIEELETSYEELQSTYEEAQSTNEELYTSTEELQTSNEELQSTNEELRTVNQELNVKTSELEATNQQLKHINERLTSEIEERKQVEANLQIERTKLNTFFNSQPNWINISTKEGIIQEVNPAALILMETDNINDLVNHSIKDFILPEYIPEIETYLNNVSAQPGMHKREIQIKTLRNNIRWIELRSVLIQLADTSPRIMSIIVDHSERKHAQELLAERQQELTHIMRLNTLGEMASGIAHELNQPLAAIANYIRGCERRMHENACTIDEITEVMQRVNIQVRRAGDILRYAKDFTRKDQNLERHAQDINLIVQDTLSLLETLEHFKEIKLITELDHNLNLVNVSRPN